MGVTIRNGLIFMRPTAVLIVPEKPKIIFFWKSGMGEKARVKATELTQTGVIERRVRNVRVQIRVMNEAQKIFASYGGTGVLRQR